MMNGKNRINIKPGTRVFIVTKKDQRSQNLTEGTVKDILTKSAAHPHGIKVRLESGEVGRVKEIIEFVVTNNREALLRPISKKVDDIFGRLHKPGRKAVSTAKMDAVIKKK
jgi:uncharacterized repeat protein (TIGR03833 family)